MNSQDIGDRAMVCTVLVTYQPSASLINNINRLIDQVGHIVLIDTGANLHLQDLIAPLGTHIHYQSCPDNNLAQAQNMGIAYARKNGFSFVLLMDDDSSPAEDMVAQMMAAYQTLDKRERIGLIAPAMVDVHSNRYTRYPVARFGIGFRNYYAQTTPVIRDTFSVIASGSLIPLHVLDAVGGMDESYVIDYIDKEFCLRLIRAGYEIVVVSAAQLHHSIGRAQDHQVLGARLTVMNHTPQRRYFIYRNRLRTIMRHGLHVPAFITYDVLAMGYDFVRIAGFESQRRAKFSAILRGIASAISGKAYRSL